MKEISLYNSIWSYSAERFMQQVSEAGNGGILVRMCCNGGGPEESFGIIDTFQSYPGSKKIQVDGYARSMGAFLLCYADKGERSCLDVSDFLFHRAAYPDWIEANSDYMSEDMWNEVKRVNAHLRAAFEATVDVPKFEKIAGKTLDEMFSVDSRIDIKLTAAQAKAVGLVDTIKTITPTIRAEVTAEFVKMAASGASVDMPEWAKPKAKPVAQATPPTNPIQKHNTMTLAELNAQHPNLVKEILTTERDRVGAWMQFHDIDAEAVTKGIADGSVPGLTQMAEFARKGMSAQAKKNITADNAPIVETEEVEVPAKEAQVKEAAFDAELKAARDARKNLN